MKANKSRDLRILKGILFLYIALCLVIAGLNYGYASRANAATASFITGFWHFYENWIKTFFIIICSFLTLRIVGVSKKKTLRQRNLIGFTIAALVVHIAGPLLFNNQELYFFTMPLPWTTVPLQMLHSSTSFAMSRLPVWGLAGLLTAFTFYLCVCALVFLGTLLFGRRWQCSTLCLFNGFASEVFAPAFPLVGKSKKIKPRTLKIFSVLRWVFLAISLFFTLYWAMNAGGRALPVSQTIISKLEVYKYLGAELCMAMFFWVAFIGRGYCYYCPLGTVLGILSKAAGQRIVTNNTSCIQCNTCNKSCPMSIDIKGKAEEGRPVTALSCVGCGHCIDACPTGTLSYSTKFLQWFQSTAAKKAGTISKEGHSVLEED